MRNQKLIIFQLGLAFQGKTSHSDRLDLSALVDFIHYAMGKKIDLLGKVFGRLTVISECPSFFGMDCVVWVCKCECGNFKNVRSNSLMNGMTKSCGCLQKENLSIIHEKNKTVDGMTSTLLYKRYRGMIGRCYCKNNIGYKYYGGRGITVSDDWRRSFLNFYRDMGEPLDGTSIERIDNNGNYCKDNCKWGTTKEQSDNKSVVIKYEFNGRMLSITDIAIITNIPRSYFYSWRKKGLNILEIIERYQEYKQSNKLKL